MFGGEYRHSIDGKGRLMIPAKYRDEIAGESLCLVTAFDEPRTYEIPHRHKQYRPQDDAHEEIHPFEYERGEP